MKFIKTIALAAVAASLALPGATAAMAAPEESMFVPFDEATVVDPDTVTFVTGGLLAADGTNLCATNPGSIVFPDGTYPCFIDFTSPDPDPVPQVGQMPVGGVDTGVAVRAIVQPDDAIPIVLLVGAAGGLAAVLLVTCRLRGV
ncbi:hypothetical protein [Arthrobacter sp. HLT1-21]